MNVIVIGASGYVGAELIGLLTQHNKISIQHLLVSENSSSSGKTFAQLHTRWQGICDLPLHSFSQQWFDQHINSSEHALSGHGIDAVFFATPHEFSAQWAQALLIKVLKFLTFLAGFV